MGMTVTDTDSVKIINKPWGWEKWMHPGGDEHRYVIKQIFLKGGARTSLQIHKHKSETIVVISGKGRIWTYNGNFDTDKFVNGLMSEQEIDDVLTKIEPVEIEPNSVVHISSNTIHRTESITDLLFYEASTPEVDDVIRIQDDTNRGHGKILSEHVKPL